MLLEWAQAVYSTSLPPVKPACQACPHCSCSCSIILLSFLILKMCCLGICLLKVPYHYLLIVCLSLFSSLVSVIQHMLCNIPQPSLPCITTHQIYVHKSIYLIVYSYANTTSVLWICVYIISSYPTPFHPTTFCSFALLTCTTILNVVTFLDYAFPIPSMLDECLYTLWESVP